MTEQRGNQGRKLKMILTGIFFSSALTVPIAFGVHQCKQNHMNQEPIVNEQAIPDFVENRGEVGTVKDSRAEEIIACAKVLARESHIHTTDAIEVMHTICNRVAENRKNKYRFRGSIIEEAQSGDYDYRPDQEYSERDWIIADTVLREWYANGRQPFCNTYYFESGKNGKLRTVNQFFENPGWAERKEREEGLYCRIAAEQYPEIKQTIAIR
jgi:hypothetical protein